MAKPPTISIPLKKAINRSASNACRVQYGAFQREFEALAVRLHAAGESDAQIAAAIHATVSAIAQRSF
jgi:hypothetical protein